MKSRFTHDEISQIVRASREAGVSIAARQHGISEQTVYNWRKRLGITDVSPRLGELKRLRLENARLKRLVAERDLEIDVMKEVAEGNNAVRMTEHLDAESGAPWIETSSNAAFTESYEEVGAGNKS